MSLPNNPSKAALTERECEILRLIAKGHTNKEIARILVVATGSIEWHVHNIIRKLGVASRAQALAQAIHLGYLNLDDL